MIIAGILCGIAGGMLLLTVIYALTLEWLMKQEREERKRQILNYLPGKHFIKSF